MRTCESPLEKRQSAQMQSRKHDEELFTPRDGSTINLLLNQIDASQFHWRKKDLALIQNFTFNCHLSLTEALYRASILIELFMNKISDFETDLELEDFSERFLNKMVEYRKGFTIKRGNSNDPNDFLHNFQENTDFCLSPTLPEEKSHLAENPIHLEIISDRKKTQKILLTMQETSQTIVLQPNNSNISSSPNPNKVNIMNNMNMITKHIELLNEIELYIPLGISELIDIFYLVFPDKDFEDIAEEWAQSIKKDKTTSHFQSKENLLKYLNFIKKSNENEEPKVQALKTLENLIILKEEALQIQMEKIKEMMELYGEFVILFGKKLWEKNNGIDKKNQNTISKENFSEFVKKTMKEKCVNLINRKLENDPKDDFLYDSKEKTAENALKNDAKDGKKEEKKGLDEIKKNINELCLMSLITKPKKEKSVMSSNSNRVKENTAKGSLFKSFYQNSANLSEASVQKKSVLKKNSMKIEENKKNIKEEEVKNK